MNKKRKNINIVNFINWPYFRMSLNLQSILLQQSFCMSIGKFPEFDCIQLQKKWNHIQREREISIEQPFFVGFCETIVCGKQTVHLKLDKENILFVIIGNEKHFCLRKIKENFPSAFCLSIQKEMCCQRTHCVDSKFKIWMIF